MGLAEESSIGAVRREPSLSLFTGNELKHLKQLRTENAALQRKLKAREMINFELLVTISQLEEPDKGTLATEQSERSMHRMHRLLQAEESTEEQLWDERVNDLVQVLCKIEDVELSNKELKKTVRRQEERLLNSEKMEADFGRDSRQLEQDLLILQKKLGDNMIEFARADRIPKMLSTEIDKHQKAVDLLRVNLYGCALDLIQPTLDEMKALQQQIAIIEGWDAAQFVASLKNKTLKDPIFNQQTTDALTSALIKLGILKPGDPRLKNMTAEEAAKLLAASGIDPATIADPVTRKALQLAGRIAVGDNNAARELVGHYMYEQHRNSEMGLLASVSGRNAILEQETHELERKFNLELSRVQADMSAAREERNALLSHLRILERENPQPKPGPRGFNLFDRSDAAGGANGANGAVSAVRPEWSGIVVKQPHTRHAAGSCTCCSVRSARWIAPARHQTGWLG